MESQDKSSEHAVIRFPIFPALDERLARGVFYLLLAAGIAGLIGTRGTWRDSGHRVLAVSFLYFAVFGALMPGLYSGRYAVTLRVFLLLFAARLAGLALDRIAAVRKPVG